jgi:hypothetical protein
MKMKNVMRNYKNLCALLCAIGVSTTFECSVDLGMWFGEDNGWEIYVDIESDLGISAEEVGEAHEYDVPIVMGVSDAILEAARNSENKQLVIPTYVLDENSQNVAIEYVKLYADLTGIESIVFPESMRGLLGFGNGKPNSVKELVFGDEVLVLRECYSDKNISATSFPESVRAVGPNVGMNMQSSEFDFKNIKVINSSCFCSMPNVKSLKLPDEMIRVSGETFCSLSSLEEFTLPANPECCVGAAMLLSCPRLRKLYSPSPQPLTVIDGTEFGTCDESSNAARAAIDKQNCVLYVPIGSLDTYAGNPSWKGFVHMVEYDPAHVDAVKSDNEALINRVQISAETVSITECNGEALTVVGMDGVVRYSDCPVGNVSIPLPHGVYVVTTESSSMKFAL